jgi:hypothetical protein
LGDLPGIRDLQVGAEQLTTLAREFAPNLEQDFAVTVATAGAEPPEHGIHRQRMVQQEMDGVLVGVFTGRSPGSRQPVHQCEYILPFKRRVAHDRWRYFWRGLEEG